MRATEAHKVRLKNDVLRALESFYVSIGTPRNADMARLADEALDRLLAYVRAAAAVDALDRLTPLCGDGPGRWCIDDPGTDTVGPCMIHDHQQKATAALQAAEQALGDERC